MGAGTTGPLVAYWERPEQVLWVYAGHRRLQGYDNYWVAGTRYGCWNDDENMGTMYEGKQGAAYEAQPDGSEVQLPDWRPPPGATTWRGYMLTTGQARAVGLI